MIAKLDIKPPDPYMPVGTLSGGNQQKVLLGKWLAGKPAVLVLHEPTQAVDVGARHDIINAIREAASDGCGVIISSVDAADLAVLCDRVLVFRDGKVAAELTGDLDPGRHHPRDLRTLGDAGKPAEQRRRASHRHGRQTELDEKGVAR